jgi:YD repeat-containing protein
VAVAIRCSARITHPDGKFFEYEYDTADRLFHLSENGPSITLASIFYDGEGLRDQLSRDAAGAITLYDFDPLARLDGLTHDLDGLGTANDVALDFNFNPASQVVTRSVSNEAYEFPFSPSVKGYVVNGRNQYTQVGGTIHTWDANGNLTGDGLTTFGYDTENRLVSASGAKAATLAYDPLGRLYQVTSSGATTRFVYDGDRRIVEYSAGKNARTTFEGDDDNVGTSTRTIGGTSATGPAVNVGANRQPPGVSP